MCNELLQAVEDLIIDKDDVWIISDRWKYLFQYNISKQRSEIAVAFPETVGTGYNAFSQMVKVENEIYLIPLTAKDIYCYDLQEKQIYKIDISFIPLPEIKNMSAIVSGRSIYCVNRFPDMVIKIDTVTKEIDMFDADIRQYIDEDSERLLYRSYKQPCVDHEKIYWANYSNMLIEFDIKELCFSVQHIEGLPQENAERMEAEGYKLRDWIIGVRIIEGIMFLFSMEGKVYQYDGMLHEIQEEMFDNYVKYSSMDKVTSPVFYDLIPIDHNLYFISCYKNDCVKYDGITKQFSKVLNSYTREWEGNRRSYTFCKAVNGTQILLYSFCESCFYLMDFEKDYVERIFIKLPIIDVMLASLSHNSNDEKSEIFTNIEVGKKIYDSTI